MSPEQHAKVLEALEIAQPARCGQSDELYAQEAALIREALSIMRAEWVGEVPEGYEVYYLKDFGPLWDALLRAQSKGYMPDAMVNQWENFDALCPAPPTEHEVKP